MSDIFKYRIDNEFALVSNLEKEIKIPINEFKQTNSELGLSIKSQLGNSSMLLNAGVTTNILYEIKDKNGIRLPDNDIVRINSIVTNKKYIDRIAAIQNAGFDIEYHSFQDSTFRLNLELIDSKLPEIIAFIVKQKYTHKITKIQEVINSLNINNPIGYDLSEGHNFYEYRIINFLMEITLGMTSKTVWSGVYDVIGGLIIVKNNSDVVCYHLIDFNKFKDYLKSSAKLDNPSGTKMGYGEIYKEGNKTFIKLNFQVKA